MARPIEIASRVTFDSTAAGIVVPPSGLDIPGIRADRQSYTVPYGVHITGRTDSGIILAHNGFQAKETEQRRAPSHRLILLTDFSSAKGAKRDDRSPNEVLIAFEDVLDQNGVKNLGPLKQDNGIYALRPISGAYLNDLYARRYENNEVNRVQVVVCDPGVGGDREGIVVKTKKGTYVGPNNGVFWTAIEREGLAYGEDGLAEVYKVHDAKFKEVNSATFHGREVFAPIAGEIASGREPSEITDWLERFEPENLVRLEYKQNQILEIDGFNLVRINKKFPPAQSDGTNPDRAKVTVTDRQTGEKKILIIPTAEKFVDMEQGDLLVYPGSDDGLIEIAASNAVHEHEPHALKQLSVKYPDNPIEPGDILDIEWFYEGDLIEGVDTKIASAS